MWSKRLHFIWLLLLLAACARNPNEVRTPLLGYSPPAQEYHFDTPTPNWDIFQLTDNVASFSLSDGALLGQVAPDRGYIWSLNHTRLDDVSIKARVQQLRGSEGNGFGIMCRADTDGNGYYFVMSSAGAFAILKAEPNLPDPSELVKWQNSPAVKQDNAVNEIEAVCVEDYLALIINGVFVAEIRDSSFTNGQLGLVLGAVEKPLSITYDDIIVREARVIGG